MLRSLFKGAITLATVSLIVTSSMAIAGQPALAGPPEDRPATAGKSDPKWSIWPLADKVEALSTLSDLLELAEIQGKLAGNKGPFTVFAPTDAAFAKLPAGTVESLLKPENKDKLTAILTYHVIPGKVMSGEIAGKMMMVKTVQGSEVSVNATDGVMIDGAKVIGADVAASNGVIHVIDTVITPKS